MQLQGKRLSDIAGDRVQIGTAALENILTISMRKYIIWLTIPRFGIYPTDLFAHEQMTQVPDYQLQLVYNSKRVEMAHTSISRRLLK